MGAHVHRIQFCVDAFDTEENRVDSDAYLTDMLEVLVRKNVRWLTRYPETPGIYESGVRYQAEAIGREDWQDIPVTLARRVGDCEDLGCWLAAQIRVRERVHAQAFFTCATLPSGLHLYHIKVRRPDGTVEDPSKVLGMGQTPLPYA